MLLEDCFNFVAADDIRVKGTRVGIESILYEYVHETKTAEQIAEQFDTVSLAQVYATILYCLVHKPEVDRYLSAWSHWGREMRQQQTQQDGAFFQRLHELRAKQSGQTQRLAYIKFRIAAQ
jgi:uncharacterized protein (DUF433 family)